MLKRVVRKRRQEVDSAPVLAGWREYVRLPELGIGPLVAKMDTGARSAALHAENLSVITVRGRHHIRFDVPVNSDRSRAKTCELPVLAERRVKNTGGQWELRLVVETEIVIGRTRWRAEVTLTNRTDMGVAMLLGRSTIKDRFLVHPGRSFLITRQMRKATGLRP